MICPIPSWSVTEQARLGNAEGNEGSESAGRGAGRLRLRQSRKVEAELGPIVEATERVVKVGEGRGRRLIALRLGFAPRTKVVEESLCGC